MGPRKKRKRGQGWTRKKMPVVTQETARSGAASSIDPLSDTTTPSESSIQNSLAFDSLRNMVMCEVGGVNNHSNSCTIKQEPDLAIYEPPPNEKGVMRNDVISEKTKAGNFTDISNPDHSDNLLFKIVNPRQIELDTFLKAGPQPDASALPSETSKKFISETPSVSEDAVSSGNIVSDSSFTESYPNSNLTISNATLHEIDSKEADDILGGQLEEEDSLPTFDSLRQLADSYLEESSNKSQSMTISKQKRKCDECGFVCKTFYDLIKHLKYKHGPSIYSCPVKGCTFTTRYPNNIKHHQIKHSQVRPYACDQCSSRFKRKTQLGYHMLTHSEERPFACDQCDFRTKRNWVLSMHITSKHSDARPFECEECGFRMKTRSDMNKHKRIHTRGGNVVCSDCNKTFPHKARLKVHRRNMHTNKPLITCPEKKCQQTFKCKGAMIKHINVIHKGIRTYSCDICCRSYSSKSNLSNHMVTHDATDRPFKCPICPFQGKEEMHVRSHMGNMHKGLRMYSCNICHVRFKHEQGLKQHQSTNKHKRNARFMLPPCDEEVKPDVQELNEQFSTQGSDEGSQQLNQQLNQQISQQVKQQLNNQRRNQLSSLAEELVNNQGKEESTEQFINQQNGQVSEQLKGHFKRQQNNEQSNGQLTLNSLIKQEPVTVSDD